MVALGGMADEQAKALLDSDDYKTTNMRFTQTALRKANPDTKTLWSTISSKGPREGKRDAQHKMLAAFALDPNMGQSFCTAIQELQLETGACHTTQ